MALPEVSPSGKDSYLSRAKKLLHSLLDLTILKKIKTESPFGYSNSINRLRYLT
jgi:hypothetical protein